MNKLLKKYMAQIKASFPILGIRERKYIKELYYDIKQYCDTNNPTSLSELYTIYGLPINVVKDFYDNEEPTLLFARLKLVSLIKKLSACVIILLITATSIHVTKSYIEYKEYADSRVAVVIEVLKEVD